MADTYREQWEAAAAVLRSHAADFDRLAAAAPPRPRPVRSNDALKVAVCEYLLQVNRDMEGSFIAPTAIDWLGDGIVNAVLAAEDPDAD